MPGQRDDPQDCRDLRERRWAILAEQPSSRAAEQPSSRAAERPSSRAAEQPGAAATGSVVHRPSPRPRLARPIRGPLRRFRRNGRYVRVPAGFDHAGAKLARYKLPQELRILPALPRNATGKLDKRAIVRLVVDPDRSE
ncbi:hypothetical protein VSH64_10845 [Amycolatopsis rhabdoformis]|uniref:AMP-binding enzyme C-terminal domain-containing protein n=1 Tax=Amycolatopsis rhabdoformis TaxID=1448059 RepID=A0ABZ1IFX7_9PSEU|nr:hypothetical protein [Amycolatopsis rhabdoformis]WSE32603.1 hypothetical protein VSH64_10845 [Amycolatopsis rhabdoformis]